jgi:hypothetical protein
VNLIARIFARPLEKETIEIDHPLQVGLGASALNEDSGDSFAAGHERCRRRSQAAAVNEDLAGIDPRMSNGLIERFSIVANLGVVVELAARLAFAVTCA